MNPDIKRAIENGNLTLFLGAGASKGCKTKDGKALLDGWELAKALAEFGGMEYDDEDLSIVYSAVKHKMQARLGPFLESKFRHVTPSDEYYALAEYAWRRIYTLNIDDGLDQALIRRSRQNIEIALASDSVKNQDQMFSRLDYIKLNGSVDRLAQGVIFSPAEYATATGTKLPWYEQSAVDFISTQFLFIGTKINEPLLKFHIERYKEVHGSSPGVSYVITPSATEITKNDLRTYNVEHIAATLSDFITWLRATFRTPPAPLTVAIANIPQLATMVLGSGTRKHLDLFDDITLIKRGLLVAAGGSSQSGSIRDFYKGFYPTWEDILNEVPAELEILSEVVDSVTPLTAGQPIRCIVGPAGSGKSTLLMQAALKISERPGWAVYHINEPLQKFPASLRAIEDSCGDDISHILLVIDNLDSFANDILEFRPSTGSRIRFLCAERHNIWSSRTHYKLKHLEADPLIVRDFTKIDAINILSKLEKFGSWTRLGKMAPEKRIEELMVRARQQLLIALLEATAGIGFQKIIETDYQHLSSDDERVLVVIVGLATLHRTAATIELVNRALFQLGLLRKGPQLLNNLVGIVYQAKDKLSVRHPMYISHLIENVIDPLQIHRAVKAVLGAFSKYQAPVMKSMSKKELRIYKGIINYKFLHRALHGKYDLIIGLYKSVEKDFEHDGLFWLQYGLAHRGFREQTLALEKLRMAYDAYPMAHTEHALAQQLLIIAPTLASAQTAMEYLDEAKTMLLRLDSEIDSDDVYPIATLAIGHVRVIRKFQGDAVARELAGTYANELSIRMRKAGGDTVLRGIWEKLAKYSSSGVWDEPGMSKLNT